MFRFATLKIYRSNLLKCNSHICRSKDSELISIKEREHAHFISESCFFTQYIFPVPPIFFLQWDGIAVCMCITFRHSSVGGHLDCFHFLDTETETKMVYQVSVG